MLKILLAILIGLSLCFPKTIFAHSEAQVVEMTKEGFEPSSISVDTNTTIIFLNRDTEPRWPASNIHPTHQIYPEFDPKRPIDPGDSWAFKPKKEGIWRYHDHLFPHMRGTITVAAEVGEQNKDTLNTKDDISLIEKVRNVLAGLINSIKSVFSFGKKYQAPTVESFIKLSPQEQINTLSEMAEKSGGDKPWLYVKNSFKGEAGSSGNIHDLAHLAGGLLYDKEGFEGVGNCTVEFAFGCYHGFLDHVFAKNLDHLLNAQKACLALGPENSGPVASCIHGIGHGVASFYLAKDLKGSLSSCRKLTSGTEYCFDGVFMEFVRNAPEDLFKKEDPLYPCNQLEREFGYTYSFACGRNQPALLMGRFQIGFDEVVSICHASDSKPFREACFDSLGFSLAATNDVIKIVSGCQKIGIAEYVNKCIKAAAGELVFQEVPGWEEKSSVICNSVPGAKDECVAHIARLISEYKRVRKINFSPKQQNEDTSSYIRRQLGVCYEMEGAGGCYKQVAQVLYSELGLAKTVALLRENESYPEVYARCHEVTHYLSRAEYEKQKSISKVYAQCDSTCHGGCYHGTLEAYLKKQEVGGKNLAIEFPKICGDKNTYQKPIEYNECLHGLGHAAMFVLDMELRESLKLCDTLSDQEHKERCYTGVFMENSSSSTSFDHASTYIKADDPFYPCNALEGKYLSLCWQYQSSYFAIISNQDWEKVAKLCLKIPSQYQDRCFRTVGTNQVGFTSSLQTMKKDCDLMPSSSARSVCVAGVASSLAYRFVGDMQKMIDFCSLTNSSDRESCFKQIGSGVLDWDKNPDVAKKECQKIPDAQGLAWCMSVI